MLTSVLSVIDKINEFLFTNTGTVRLIRTACKAFQKHGSEQSGVHIHFSTFLAANYHTKRVPLASFRGNRFNILFHNGGTLYYLQCAIKEFFAQGLTTDNLLIQALQADVKVPEFWAGCRALGLVNKFVTGPFWRLLESEVTITQMNDRYQNMVDHFEEWSRDASSLLTGEARLFPGISLKIDNIFDSLLVPDENNTTVQEILQALFAAFSTLFRRMVADHLNGIHEGITEDEIASVPKNNIISERDFAQLDRLLRQKPNASTLALEAMILFANNKTASWLKSKSEAEIADLLKTARSKAPEFRKLFQHRREVMLEERAKIQRAKVKAVAEKRARERQEKQKLTEALLESGLWQTNEQIITGLASLKSKTAKLKALKCQLDFRKKVLQQTYPDKTVFQATVQGKKLSVDEMTHNLLKLLSTGSESDTPTQPPKDSEATDLVGKRICHRWLVADDEEWFTGHIMSVVPGTNSWFNVKYDGEDQILTLNLFEDMQSGDLYLL